MHYVSTRDSSRRLTASQAIVEGLSRDGGLYLPESIPQLTLADIRALARLSYPERAAKIMKLYLEEFSEEELLGFAQKAYGPAKFDTPAAAPVVQLADNTYIQELWHGPTCAFKDMALQMLPYLLTASLKKTGEEKTVCILVATSGDTGKAALEGFRDVDRTKILVFYPDGGVSEIQKLQMVTQEGRNVGVCAVRGNFDDAQTGVKRIFSDAQLRETLASRGYFLSSANSINWAGSCRRSCITSRRTATCSPPAPSRKDRPSTSACRRATSATSSPASTRRRWACPSAGSSARRTRITS